MSIQVTNLGIIDLGTVYLGKTVVKWKIINIPGGVASLDNTTISTVGVDINNLNIYNKTIWLEDQVKHIIKIIQQFPLLVLILIIWIFIIKLFDSKTKLNILLKEISNQLLKLLSNPNYKKMFNLLFNEKSIFKVVVLASPGL